MAGEYPYEYARVSAMKSALLRKEDYDRLAKVGIAEMAKMLEEKGYREVVELASSNSGAKLVEAAAELHHERIMEKVARVCTSKLKPLVRAYLRNSEVEKLKHIIRNAHSRHEPLAELMKKQRAVPFRKLKDALSSYEKSGILSEIENALDSYYYGQLLLLAAASEESGEARVLKAFFESISEAAAARMILKARQEGVQLPQIPFLQKSLRRIAQLSPDEAAKAIAARYSIAKDDVSGLSFEVAVLRKQLAIARRLWKPLSAGAVISFLAMQETEALNVRMLLKAKESGSEKLAALVVAS